jgi:hypothetical protein
LNSFDESFRRKQFVLLTLNLCKEKTALPNTPDRDLLLDDLIGYPNEYSLCYIDHLFFVQALVSFYPLGFQWTLRINTVIIIIRTLIKSVGIVELFRRRDPW